MTTDRPPNRKTGIVSLVAVVEKGLFNGGGLGYSFLVVESTNNIEEVDGNLPKQ